MVLSRYGVTLESFGRYRKAGINVGIGTDCHPHNMLEEMREAAILVARHRAAHVFRDTADVFDAATIDGAKALLRDDIGRLDVGTKADIVEGEGFSTRDGSAEAELGGSSSRDISFFT